MEKRPLDTELEVLWSEHLEDDVFSVRAYNVLAHRLGLRTLGDILNLTRDDIAKARGAGKKTLDDIAKLVRSCGYELNGFTDAGPDCKKCKQRDFLRPAHQHVLKLAREFNRCEEDERLVLSSEVAGQHRRVTFLTESGLYSVLAQSRKPVARAWRRVIAEELIALRRSRGKNISEQFEDWDHMADTIYFDEVTGRLMRSVTVPGGDVEQVPYEP